MYWNYENPNFLIHFEHFLDPNEHDLRTLWAKIFRNYEVLGFDKIHMLLFWFLKSYDFLKSCFSRWHSSFFNFNFCSINFKKHYLCARSTYVYLIIAVIRVFKVTTWYTNFTRVYLCDVFEENVHRAQEKCIYEKNKPRFLTLLILIFDSWRTRGAIVVSSCCNIFFW